MATARNINLEPETVHAVTLEYINGVLTVSAHAFNINGYTDAVTFTNSANSTATITLVFAANPPGGTTPALFTFPTYPNLTLAPGATSASLSPQYLNGGVNYTVQVNGTQVGEIYGVESGSPTTYYGPMVVRVSGTTCTPQTVVVPYHGTILFYSTDGLSHPITWGTNAGNPFPGLTTVYPQGNPGNSPRTETLPVNDFPYTMGAGLTATGGGGTVKVKSVT